jgi:prolyl oligopeptidase
MPSTSRTALAVALSLASVATAAGTLTYPQTKTDGTSDVYHGVKVDDPYRWLEQDVRESDDVRKWVEAENKVTFAYLEGIPERDRIKQRLTQLWNFEKYGVPHKEGDHYFYLLNDGLQNQSVLYTQAGLSDAPKAVIDPNSWSKDGTVALAELEVSPDGRYAAYSIQDGGTDWRIWRVLEIATGKLLDDELRWVKFSDASWRADSAGFYYSRYPAPQGEEFQSLNMNHTVYYHQVGTPQTKDPVVYTNADHPDWGYGPQVTDDGKYLVITVWKGTDEKYQIATQDLADAQAKPRMIIEGFDHDYTFIGSDGDQLYFRTNDGAPNGRLIAIDARKPERAQWREIVPESKDVIVDASLVGGRFVVEYLHDAYSLVRVYERDGRVVRDVKLPGIGSVDGFEGRFDDPETFYAWSSFNAPTTIYRYDVASGESTLFKQAKVDFNPDDYVVEQVFYRSKDGTRVPMFLAHRKGISQDGNNPTLLYGYGGFNLAQTPGFKVERLAWMEMGGIFALANLRGGSEYGEAWHEAGKKLNKQNVFDDFTAAGEYLVAEKYTRPARLGIFGRSNGGLLIGAVLNQRPDLFGAALPAVGVMDMLRFNQFTAGRFWVDDYGSAENADDFKALYAYSPYHNLRKGTKYPATLVTTADTDDRVVPGHSFKYAAALQAAQAGDAPVLIRIETRAGHGSGKPTDKLIEEFADEWAFLVASLHVELPADYAAK